MKNFFTMQQSTIKYNNVEFEKAFVINSRHASVYDIIRVTLVNQDSTLINLM